MYNIVNIVNLDIKTCCNLKYGNIALNMDLIE